MFIKFVVKTSMVSDMVRHADNVFFFFISSVYDSSALLLILRAIYN